MEVLPNVQLPERRETSFDCLYQIEDQHLLIKPTLIVIHFTNSFYCIIRNWLYGISMFLFLLSPCIAIDIAVREFYRPIRENSYVPKRQTVGQY